MYNKVKQYELGITMSTNTQGKPNRYEPCLEDGDLMSFGKYKDELMQDVSPSYLLWLWNDGIKEYSGQGVLQPNSFNNKRMLANYIYNSRNAINQELGRVAIV